MAVHKIEFEFEVAFESDKKCGGRGCACERSVARTGASEIRRGESTQMSKGIAAARVAVNNPELRHEIQLECAAESKG
jgi:hypothetical protein